MRVRNGVYRDKLKALLERRKVRKEKKHAQRKLEDENLELIEVEVIEEPKKCEHGRGMTEYCLPCNRVNGGG